MSIVLKTEFLTYEISDNGTNISFREANGRERIIPSPAAIITESCGTEIPSVGASLSGDILTLNFADGTVAALEVSEKKSYLTFTVKSVSREDFLSLSFINLHLSDTDGDNEGVLLAMTAHTRMAEHPGDNRNLIASAYPHIGIFSTKRSKYPAKAAVFSAPRCEVRRIEKEILDEIPNGELPKPKTGGPYADTVKEDARADYYILMQDTATLDNADSLIAEMKRFAIKEITLHHNTHYRQGDFTPIKSAFPDGASDFKAVVDKFHENGIKVGLQSYSFFLARSSSYISPVPHRDLDILKTFTLSGDISDSSLSLCVMESTEGVVADEGFIFVNSPYLWIDDEIVRFEKAENGRFTLAERGAYGTTPAPHENGSEVKQLKQYFLLPIAKAGSELFYEIAKNTAEFINEVGADYFYLDALDGAFVLDGEDFVWYHAMDFVCEMYRHLKRDIIFDCCYNPGYTGTWFVRSRYGAIDVSLNAHRACFDAHTEYNERTAKRMGITSELGWIDLFPHAASESHWLNEPIFEEDLEYVCAKAFATEASLSFLESFRKCGTLPSADTLSEILRAYSELRQNQAPTKNTSDFLIQAGNGATLKDGKLYERQHHTVIFESGAYISKINNELEKQTPKFRLQALYSAEEYGHPDAKTLLWLDENEPIRKPISIRFDTPISAEGKRGVGVFCKGDGSGAVITVSIRNFALNARKSAEHYIVADFVGWRYFAFYEAENGTLDKKSPKKLEYKTYNHLQEFYGYYRTRSNYDAIDGVDITVTGSDSICLRPILMLPHIAPPIVDPVLRFGNSEMQIFTTLKPDENLYFDGESCVVKDKLGYEIERPEYFGTPTLECGENTIELIRSDNLSRAKLTVITDGDELQ